MGYIFDDIPAPSDHETHISLSSLVLQAQSQAAYRLATEYAIEFTRWLSSGILIRRGQLLDFTPTQSFAPPQDNVAISFFTLSTHPVQEGRVEGGVTHIVILPCLASSTTRSRTDILSVDEDVQDLEIDESFLSGSMLSPSAPGHIALPGGMRLYPSAHQSPINYLLQAGAVFCRHLRREIATTARCIFRPVTLVGLEF